MSPFWLIGAACGLSLAWLLPNHTYPWLGFHGDAWSAVMLALISVFVFWKNKCAVGWYWSSMAVCIMVVIPLLQWVTGLIPIFGVAWINFAYLLGLLLAMHLGAAWEFESPGQVMDFLFTAIGIAAVVSVGLQLRQFLQLESIGPYTMYSTGSRHFANMAQPNQLASLLLLGVVGCAWGYGRSKLGAMTAVSIAALLLVGLAITESRTGWVNIALLMAIAAIWRRLLPSARFLYAVVGLGVFFLVCVLVLPMAYAVNNGGVAPAFRSPVGDPRWSAWLMFLKAAAHNPILGFGWGQTGHAQFLMMDDKIVQGGNFLHAHNMVIDLIIWNGIPMGLAISILMLWWVWIVIKNVRDFSHLAKVAFLMILGVHAMLEYPLQYAFFLLPAGMVAGSLNLSSGQVVFGAGRKWLMGTLLALALITLVVTVQDYFKVERSFYALRFELKNIPTSLSREPPEVLALTQWREHIQFVRMEPQTNVRPIQLEWMREVAMTTPSAYAMYRLALMLAMNDMVGEAQLWLRRACQTSPGDHCDAIRNQWKERSSENSKYAAVAWPEEFR
jgi:O-antigen ligase